MPIAVLAALGEQWLRCGYEGYERGEGGLTCSSEISASASERRLSCDSLCSASAAAAASFSSTVLCHHTTEETYLCHILSAYRGGVTFVSHFARGEVTRQACGPVRGAGRRGGSDSRALVECCLWIKVRG
eukprot:7263677-Pyramimonas_sp.AAC.1